MFDDIVICLLVLSLVFFAGLQLGSKHPVYRARRKLAETRAELAACKADIAAVTPLKIQAHKLTADVRRLTNLKARREEIERQAHKLTADLSDIRHRQEHKRLSTSEVAQAPGLITHWSCEKARLGEELATVVAELKPLERSVKEQSAALEDARSMAMIDRGLGSIEEVSTTID